MRVSPILVVALCAPLIAAAQSTSIMEWPVAAGTRVRIESAVLGGGLQKGNVATATADKLVFQPIARRCPNLQSHSEYLAAGNRPRPDCPQGARRRYWL